MTDFQGTSWLTLRPGANAVPITWRFAAASAATTNDGSLPYATTISNATVAFYDSTGSNNTGVLVANSTQITGGNTVSCAVKHPDANNVFTPKRYTAVITLTLNTGVVLPFEWTRLIVDGRPG